MKQQALILHAGRYLALQELESELSKRKLRYERAIRIAVVGGTSQDPEIYLLRDLIAAEDFEVETLGIERCDFLFDLNSTNDSFFSHSFSPFDFVLCSQVIEHIWNLNNGFQNLAKLVCVGGYIWINAPSSNHKHLSPDYFSAGYQSNFVSKNIQQFGVKEILSGEIGSRRLYLMTHHFQYWPTYFQLKYPFMRGVWPFTLRSIFSFIKNLPTSIRACFWSNTTVKNTNWCTEMFYLGERTNGRV